MVHPEFSVSHNPESISLEVEMGMSPKDHLTVQAFISTAAQELRHNAQPTRRDVICNDIPLIGGVPLSLQSKIGAGYREMNFSLIQYPDSPSDSAIKLELTHSELNDNALIITDINPSTYCGDKIFWVNSDGEGKSSHYLHGSDISQLLDSVLKTDERFSQLTDPRHDKPATFDGLVSVMEQTLIKRTPNPVEIRSFSTETYDFDVGENVFLPYERNACLKISQASNGTGYSLDLFGVYNIGFDKDEPLAHVVKRIQYSYSHHKTNDARNMSSSVSVTSKELSRPQLEEYLLNEHRHWNPVKIIHAAIKDIHTTHSQHE